MVYSIKIEFLHTWSREFPRSVWRANPFDPEEGQVEAKCPTQSHLQHLLSAAGQGSWSPWSLRQLEHPFRLFGAQAGRCPFFHCSFPSLRRTSLPREPCPRVSSEPRPYPRVSLVLRPYPRVSLKPRPNPRVSPELRPYLRVSPELFPYPRDVCSRSL